MGLPRRWIYATIAFVAFSFAILGAIYVKLYGFPSETYADYTENQLHLPETARSTSCRIMCTTKDCIITSAELISAVNDLHFDPCVDFHHYSCGNIPAALIDDNGIPEAGPEQSLLVDIINVLAEIPDDEIEPVRQLKTYYDNCVHYKSAEEKVIPGILRVLSKIGLSGWPSLPQNWTFQTHKKSVSLDYVLVGLELLKSHNLLYTTYEVSQTGTLSEKPAVDVTIKTSSYPSMKKEHLKPDEHENELLLHKQLIQNIFEYLDVEPENAETYAADVLQMEREIALWMDQNPSSLNIDPERESISTSEWKDYVQPVLLESGIDLDSIDVQILSYTKSFRSMIQSHPDAKVANHLAYRFIKGNLEDFGFFFRGFFRDQVNKYSLSLIHQGMPISKRCAFKTAFYFEPALSYWYISQRLDTNTIAQFKDMYYSIYNLTFDIIDDITWLNETMKSKTKQAIASTNSPTENIDTYSDRTFIENLYQPLDIHGETFLENTMEYTSFEKRTFTKGRLTGRMQSVGAKGVLSPNAMVDMSGKLSVGLGFIRFPHFSVTRNKPSNIGMLGNTLAHELVHVIQRAFDGKVFRSTEMPGGFQEYKNCVTKYYSHYKFQYIDQFLNGDLSFLEDFADLLGTEIAYRAYRQAAQQNGDKFEALGLTLTEEQLFFVLFAQLYCQPLTEKMEMLMFMSRDPHNPNRFRVLGTASNLPHFSEAFHCPENSPMNPKDKCEFIH